MNKDDAEVFSRSSEQLGRPQLGGGRLGTYTVLGAATGIVPLPWVPDAIGRRIRGALVHDLTARHGLSITPEARKVLVEGEKQEGARRYLDQGIKFAAAQVLARIGPFGAISPVRGALQTFVLGHLLQRYLDGARRERAVRIEFEEARALREAIDAALVLALTTDGQGKDRPAFAPEDLRDGTTQVIDGVLISIASAPGWLLRRLDAAFDEVLPHHVRR
ncbi:MAG: hypothetical protein KIT84_03610 [Labilithrix sp.]|nr:hypothetical protein [Labilithrix sp.]MCW5810070.1 hypothetical protein [Labilithrix sp.]